MTSYGKKIEEERIKKGWSKVYLGKMAGCSEGTIRYVEKGNKVLNVENIFKLSDALGLDRDEIFKLWLDEHFSHFTFLDKNNKIPIINLLQIQKLDEILRIENLPMIESAEKGANVFSILLDKTNKYFEQGSILIVNPHRSPQDNNYVAYIDEKTGPAIGKVQIKESLVYVENNLAGTNKTKIIGVITQRIDNLV
jgi:transcriptional regulator with XRE-family HTH domain